MQVYLTGIRHDAYKQFSPSRNYCSVKAENCAKFFVAVRRKKTV